MDSSPPPGAPSRFGWLQTWPGILTTGFAALLLLIAVAYLEENWRGEQIWLKTKAELEARGEILDRMKLIPPPVPDDQNFGALDYFKTDSAGASRIRAALHVVGNKTPYSADDAKEHKDDGYLPYTGRWTRGETANVADVQMQLEDFLHHQSPTTQLPAGATPVEIFTKICPVPANLRQANAQRPLCRFNIDYAPPNPWLVKIGLIVDQIFVAKVMAYDSNLALLSHNPDIALQDSQVDWKICSGLARQPFIVSGLVAVGVVAIQLNVIEQGLYEHDWTDAQLAQIDGDLGQMNVLAMGQYNLRSEVPVSAIPTMDLILGNRPLLQSMISGELGTGGTATSTFSFEDLKAYADFETWQELGTRMFYSFIPNGWLRISEARKIRGILDSARAIDPAAHRVDSARVDALTPPANAKGLDFFLAENPMIHGIRKFAYSQTQIDMTRIACRLERYRLAHGAFPATLDALVPAYGAELPHDVITGGSYIYRLDPDGNYKLYSTGWNGKDDHGDLSTPSATYPPTPMDSSLDWVWTNHVTLKK